jgi:hypothetical protein
MTEEWVSFWYQCLSQNVDYSIYCNARAADDKVVCAKLEAQFDRIADIYKDFGELDGWHEAGLKSAQWNEWFQPRRHLFMVSAAVFNDAVGYAQPGHILINVPLLRDSAATVELVRTLLDDHYSRNEVASTPAPKYTLNMRGGRLAHGYEKVRQACASAARSYRYDPQTMEERRHVDAVADFIHHEIDNMGWKLDPAARKELMEFGRLSEQRLDSFKAMLNRCRRDFQAFSRNTVRGSFPDDRPFESQVLNIF